MLNSERFLDASPRQVYATLLDDDVYLCSWRTMYRLPAITITKCADAVKSAAIQTIYGVRNSRQVAPIKCGRGTGYFERTRCDGQDRLVICGVLTSLAAWSWGGCSPSKSATARRLLAAKLLQAPCPAAANSCLSMADRGALDEKQRRAAVSCFWTWSVTHDRAVIRVSATTTRFRKPASRPDQVQCGLPRAQL